MNRRFPWDSIATPKADLKLIRVDETHHHNFSWGKDASGKLLLVLALPGADADDLRKRKIELTGIKTDIRFLSDTDSLYFKLTLQASENTDIFYTLCNDLIEQTRTVPDLKSALSLLYKRLERWRTFLSKSNKSLLTLQEIQGLFAELSFLEECVDQKHVTAQAAVEGWQGPLGAPHDFIFGMEAVEIKSIGGSFSNGVWISNEGQLTSHLRHLFLRVVFLVQDFDCNTGASLNGLVRRLSAKLSSEVLYTLENRLSQFGYIDIPDYDRPCFAISQTRSYEVREGFPSLTPQNIPQGISEVSYFISFASIENFLIQDYKPGNLQ